MDIDSPGRYRVQFSIPIERVVERYQPEPVPDFRLEPVANNRLALSSPDTSRNLLNIRLNPDVLYEPEYADIVENMILYGLSQLQFYNSTPIGTLEEKVENNPEMMSVIEKTMKDSERNQSFAIHHEEKAAFRHLGKTCFDITNAINQEIGGNECYDYGMLVRLRGLNKNLATAQADYPDYSADYIMHLWSKSKPLGIELGNGNKQVEYLKGELEAESWREFLPQWKKFLTKMFSRFPSFDPDDYR